MKSIFKNKAMRNIATSMGVLTSVMGCTMDTSQGAVVNRSGATITTPTRDYASEIQKTGVSPISLYQQVSRQSNGPNFDIKPKVVKYDPGGGAKDRINEIANILSTGQVVMIEGACISSCAMLLVLDNYDQLCVLNSAKFGFHAPFTWSGGLSDKDREEWIKVIGAHYPKELRTRYFEVGSQSVWSMDRLSAQEVRQKGNIPSCSEPRFAALKR